MDSTKSEKMPTTCHRRMSQNTTVSLVSGGGLGLGGAVLGCGSREKGVNQVQASRQGWGPQGLSPHILKFPPKAPDIRHQHPRPQKKSKIQNKSSGQSPRPCHQELGLRRVVDAWGNKAQRRECGQPVLASTDGVSGPRPETRQGLFHGLGGLPG